IPLTGSTEYWDSASKSSYTYNPTTKDLLAYDSVYAVYEKCQYVWDHGLAGIIAWEASNDVRDSKNRRSLFAAMNRCLSKDPRRNHGTKCNTNVDSKGCAATAVATCKNNVWVVKDCPNGQVCVGTDWNTRCQTPANPEIWN
ncbi:Endochitinase 1, partial [Rhizoclosmatium hyalinum]